MGADVALSATSAPFFGSVRDEGSASDEALWLRWIELFRSHWPFDEGPDVVCSSDPYVAELARRLGAEPVVVDADREHVPISATMVRTDPAAHLAMLAPPVRDWVEANWVDPG